MGIAHQEPFQAGSERQFLDTDFTDGTDKGKDRNEFGLPGATPRCKPNTFALRRIDQLEAAAVSGESSFHDSPEDKACPERDGSTGSP